MGNNDSVVKKTIKPAVDFINKIEPNDKVLVVYGHDNDSICSAAIVSKLVKKFKSEDVNLFSTKDNFAVNDDDADEISKMEADYIIVLDIAHLSSSYVEKVLSTQNSMIIDHHQPLSLTNITYCNPRNFEKKIYMPVSYIVYKIYQKFGDASEVAWIAGIGVLSDHAVSIARDLFDEIKKFSPKLIGNTALKEESLFSYSLIGTLAKIFDSARIVSGRIGSVLAARALLNSSSYEDIMKSGNSDAAKLIMWSDIVRHEFKRLVADFNKKKKTVKKNIIYYEIPSKYFIKSSLSGYLVQFYKDKILVLTQKSRNNLYVSFRRGEKVKTDLNKLAKKAVKGIPDSEGGGHEAASGAKIPVKYISKFLKQL